MSVRGRWQIIVPKAVSSEMGFVNKELKAPGRTPGYAVGCRCAVGAYAVMHIAVILPG